MAKKVFRKLVVINELDRQAIDKLYSYIVASAESRRFERYGEQIRLLFDAYFYIHKQSVQKMFRAELCDNKSALLDLVDLDDMITQFKITVLKKYCQLDDIIDMENMAIHGMSTEGMNKILLMNFYMISIDTE